MRFSQRIGKKSIKTVFQIESIDQDLKVRLWNIFFIYLHKKTYASTGSSSRSSLYLSLWKEFFNLPIDEIKGNRYNDVDDILMKQYIKEWYEKSEWYDVFDFLEFLIGLDDYTFSDDFSIDINEVLRLEVSAYRIIDNHVVEINAENEIKEIEDAIEVTDKMKSVNTHLTTALDMISDRNNPDYRNSIKESISAVEAYCKIITGNDKATLGKALAVIENTHKIHGSLKTAFTALYGYTSDSGGIRHAIIEGDTIIHFEEAKFMLVSCSSFINYLALKVAV